MSSGEGGRRGKDGLGWGWRPFSCGGGAGVGEDLPRARWGADRSEADPGGAGCGGGFAPGEVESRSAESEAERGGGGGGGRSVAQGAGGGLSAVGGGRGEVGGYPLQGQPPGGAQSRLVPALSPRLAAAPDLELRRWRRSSPAQGKAGSGPGQPRDLSAPPALRPLPALGPPSSPAPCQHRRPLLFPHFLEFFSRPFVQVPPSFCFGPSVFSPEISERPLISVGLLGLFTPTVGSRVVPRGSVCSNPWAPFYFPSYFPTENSCILPF